MTSRRACYLVRLPPPPPSLSTHRIEAVETIQDRPRVPYSDFPTLCRGPTHIPRTASHRDARQLVMEADLK